LLSGREGEPSLLARATGTSDVTLHEYAGWGLALAAAIGIVVGIRGAVTFVGDSFRYERGDGRWLLRWPGASFTGRFGHHAGHFDPGQRIANVVLAGSLLSLTVSGLGLMSVSGGPAFVWFLRVHKYSTYVTTVFIAGHVLVASGLLPGYRGVWRGMHWRGGGVPETTARRLWPEWTERTLSSEAATSRPTTRRTD
jgi:formate dehydrogenase subunit gamma